MYTHDLIVGIVANTMIAIPALTRRTYTFVILLFCSLVVFLFSVSRALFNTRPPASPHPVPPSDTVSKALVLPKTSSENVDWTYELEPESVLELPFVIGGPLIGIDGRPISTPRTTSQAFISAYPLIKVERR